MTDADRPGEPAGDELAALQQALRAFARERDWEQYHLPKNLVLALVGEVGELAELFQWRTPAESDPDALDEASRAQVRDELADVFLYLLRLSDVLGVDLVAAAADKLAANAERYPAGEVRGSAEKRP